MTRKLEVATFVPILFLILTASYLGIVSLISPDPYLRKLSLSIAICLFLGGVVMAFGWMFYWAVFRVFERKTA